MLMIRSRFAVLLLCAVLVGGCKDEESSGFAGELAFSGEHDFLPGFEVDTGWTPEQSPASVRVTASAGGQVAVVAKATTDGSVLMPVPESGELSVEGSLILEVNARIDASGVQYEGVVDSFEYGIESPAIPFEPFALDQPVSATAQLPAEEIARAPIPSVPGSTLVLEITGGSIDTVFEGTCATAADGFAQFTGRTTMSASVEAASSIEIEIPIVGTETFGPFAFTIGVPEIVHTLDLGTVSLTTGETVPDRGICSSTGDTSSDAGGPTTDSSDDTASAGTTASGSDDATTSGADGNGTTGDGSTTTGDGSTTSTTGNDHDPVYPYPRGGQCPDRDQVAVGTVSDNNVVCLPPCDAMGTCPDAATGTATALCVFNPEASYADCTTDTECAAPESCVQNVCWIESTHCLLYCDMGETCPDAMICDLGVCVYPQ